MMEKYKVGIIGGTGMVGQRFITLMENHPWFQLTCIAASPRSAGKRYEEAVANRWAMTGPIPAEARDLVVLDAQADVEKIAGMVDFVFCAVDMKKDEIRALEETYAKAECPVVSNNSAHRWTDDVPMVVPEINPEHLEVIAAQRARLGTKRGFIAVKSNCSLQSYVPALHPLKKYGLETALVCTYQAISGAGKTFERWPEMVDNCIPYIGGEEEKSEQEPLKLWGSIENGKIVKATANNTEKINQLLDIDENARYFGEFALGVNPYILHPMKDTLFDEKIAGSIHFTPGNCYDDAYNGNHSAIHWDMVLIMTPEYGGGEIWFDDVLIRKDGIFVVPELECLNPENLK